MKNRIVNFVFVPNYCVLYIPICMPVLYLYISMLHTFNGVNCEATRLNRTDWMSDKEIIKILLLTPSIDGMFSCA